MKIGLDLSRMKESGRTGIGNYTYYIVYNLAKIDKENEYVLYFKNEPSVEFLNQLTCSNPKITHKVITDTPWTQWGLAKECFFHPPDVLFAPWHTLPILRKPQVKIVATIHGLEHKKGKGYPLFYTAHLANKVIAVSEFTRKKLVDSFYIDSNKICVVPEGVDQSQYHKRSGEEVRDVRGKYNIGSDYALFVGTLSKRKNIRRIIKAFLSTKDDSKCNVKLVLAGNIPPEFEDLKATYWYEKGADVMLLGMVPQEDLYALLSGAKFLIYASIEEGFGLPILEAMACGTPVITSNTGAMPEVGGNAAYYVDPKSHESLVSGIKHMLLEVELRERLIQLGYERVKEFTWEKAARETLNVFEEAHGKKKRFERKIAGVRVDLGLDINKVLGLIEQGIRINDGTCRLVSTVNSEFIMDAQADSEFRDILNSSYLSLPDGVGILYANKYIEEVRLVRPKSAIKLFLKGLSLPFKNNLEGKISGVDLVYKMCKLAAEKGYSVFLLGGWEKDFRGKMKSYHGDVAGKAAKELKKLYPKLNVVGATSEFSYKPSDDKETLDYIYKCMRNSNCAHIDMLFVAYNHLKQEKWIKRNGSKIPARVGVGVGGTLDYISGNETRPPEWIISIHLEWLYRLLQRPWRLKRVFRAFPEFPIFIFKNVLEDQK